MYKESDKECNSEVVYTLDELWHRLPVCNESFTGDWMLRLESLKVGEILLTEHGDGAEETVYTRIS